MDISFPRASPQATLSNQVVDRDHQHPWRTPGFDVGLRRNAHKFARPERKTSMVAKGDRVADVVLPASDDGNASAEQGPRLSRPQS